jgi:hypothetical protein
MMALLCFVASQKGVQKFRILKESSIIFFDDILIYYKISHTKLTHNYIKAWLYLDI